MRRAAALAVAIAASTLASGHAARDRGGMHIAFNHIPDPETDK